MIEFICSNAECRKRLQVGGELAGKKVKCPKCKTVMVVPRPDSGTEARDSTGYEATMALEESPGEGNGTAADAEGAEAEKRDVGPGPAASEGEQEKGGMEALEAELEQTRRPRLPYQAEKELARGGMGAILLARDKAIRRELAVKVMRPQIADSEEHRLRFLEEAQVTGQLEHPNIVPIHELGKDAEGNLYFTMKLVKGKSLGELLKELKSVGEREYGSMGDEEADKSADAHTSSPTPPHSHTPTLSLSDLLNVFLKICDGIAFAHSKGVIHRDLKPDNIMVGEFGEVQIMDWGLAKVGGDKGPGTRDEGQEEGGAGVSVQVSGGDQNPDASGLKPETRNLKPRAAETESAIRRADTVRSVRSESDVALTVDGQITGTPAYMPPEQAEGKLELIDHRSDVYSLGAILYEILTLERPIEGDTVHKVLLNVSDGNITPPERRAPHRNVPKELSAITLKAMEKNRRKRYQSVPELSQDIKRFLEGRSVSAREDSFAESVVKLVKRNKAVSLAVGVAAAFLVTTTSFFVVGLKQERDRAVASENRALVAEEQQRETALAASKRFASQAIRAAEAGRWDEAERRAEDADTVALKTPWGSYAKGSFARMKHDYVKAAELSRKALATDPGHRESQAALSEALASMGQIADVEKLLASIDEIRDWRTLLKAGRALYAANRWRECQRPLELGLKLMEKDKDAPEGLRNKTSEEIGEMIDAAKAEAACEGFYEEIKDLPPAEQIQRVEAKLSEINGVTVKIAGRVIRDRVWVEASLRYGGDQLRHLHPFRGLSLQKLDLLGCYVRSLAPLKGMPLAYLACNSGFVSDLNSLRGMPLTHLACHQTGVSDLGPLQGMRLTRLECYTTKVSDLTPLRGMPLEHLNCKSSGVVDLEPLRGMPLTYLSVGITGVNDLSPLRGMPLTYLNCHGTKVSDLSPLEGLPLRTLILSITREVSDLSPLAGMPLTHLNCYVTRVSDLSPLKGMPLEELDCSSTGVEDLSPLKGLPLKRLNIANTKVSDLGPLKGLPLTQLACLGTRVRDLGPLKGMALTHLRCDDRKYTDLTPLAGMPLKYLLCLKKDLLTPESVKVVEELIRQGCQVTW